MIPAPLIRDEAISRVHGVHKGTAQVLGASWEVLPVGSPVEASGPTYFGSFLEIFEAGPLYLRENPLLKSTSNACSGLTHFVQTHVRLTFCF